ncbi:MAG: hypothetical protein IJK90_06315 [Bacteroidales bacterium]|nr:hypothetical protein [Bacteroidales bacterium]
MDYNTDMKYSYVFDINRALSRAFTRNIQLSLREGGATVEDLASDIDVALDLWRSNVDRFRSDNSARFASRSPMPPEVRDLAFFLKECRGIARRRANYGGEDNNAWDDRAFGLAIAVGIVASYYPEDDQSSRREKNQSKTRGEAHRPTAHLSDYLIGVTVDAFRGDLSPKVRGKKGSAIGEIIRKEILAGRLLRKRGYVSAFLREFDLMEQKQGVCKYLRRRMPNKKVLDDGAE